MVDGTTAEARFQRLLHVLPAASRKEGAALPDLAAALGTSEKRILDDIEQVTARAYYHSGGWPDDVQIMIEPERVRVTHAGGMTRPVQLTRMETLCLALALRGSIASTQLSEPEAREALRQRSETHLGQGKWGEEEALSVAAPPSGSRRGGHPRDVDHGHARAPSVCDPLCEGWSGRWFRARDPSLCHGLRGGSVVHRRALQHEERSSDVSSRSCARCGPHRRQIRGASRL